MLEYARGDILSSDADALVNPVNVAGVMGKGLALEFKRAYPGNYRAYVRACAEGRLRTGRVLIVDTGRPGPGRWVVNLPTKGHWRDRSRLGDIEAGLADLVEHLATLPVTSVAVPPLGCGLGGLPWARVHPLIEAAAAARPDVRWVVYPPR